MPSNPRCTAKTKAGHRCKRPPVKGTKRCLAHTEAATVSDDGIRTAAGTFAVGNPGGPGRPSLAGEILKVLAENDEDTGKPNVHQIAVATVKLAKSGSIGHVQLIIDRTDGKVSQPVEVSNPPGEAFKVVDLASFTPEELAAYESNLKLLAGVASRSDGGAEEGPVLPGADKPS